MIVSNVNFASSAVSGVPSDHVTPRRIRNVYVSPSDDWSQRSASPGMGRPVSASIPTSPSNIRAWTIDDAVSVERSGFKVCASPDVPYTSIVGPGVGDAWTGGGAGEGAATAARGVARAGAGGGAVGARSTVPGAGAPHATRAT